MDPIATREQETENTKWPFVLIQNVTCVLYQKTTMGCIDRVLPEQLLKHKSVSFPHQMVLDKSTKTILQTQRRLLFCTVIYIAQCYQTRGRMPHKCRWKLCTEVMLCWGKRANDAMQLSLHLYIINSSQLTHSLKEKRRYYLKGK